MMSWWATRGTLRVSSRAAPTCSPSSMPRGDATAERELGEKYNVQGYPTLKWFKDGEASDFNGGRDHDSIVSWVRKKTGPPSRKLTDQASLDAFAKEGDAVLVGLFKEGDVDLAEYEKAAGSLGEIQ